MDKTAERGAERRGDAGPSAFGKRARGYIENTGAGDDSNDQRGK
jgi:hypothetical protein